MTVLTAADVLRRARDLVVARGWSPLEGKLGIYGAVALAVLGHAMGEGGPFEDEAHWRAAVDGPCRFIDRIIGPGWAGIAHWEMADDRTELEVLDLLERAARVADQDLQPEQVAA